MQNVKFWTAIGTEEQLDFDGRTHIKDVMVGETHIVVSEVLLCRQSRERLKNEAKAKRHKVVSVRPQGAKLCPKCEEKFKQHPDLAWMKWVNPPEPKNLKPIYINPMILESNEKNRLVSPQTSHGTQDPEGSS